MTLFLMSLASCQSTNNRTNSTGAGTHKNPILDTASADPWVYRPQLSALTHQFLDG
jgi:hypothetical protein